MLSSLGRCHNCSGMHLNESKDLSLLFEMRFLATLHYTDYLQTFFLVEFKVFRLQLSDVPFNFPGKTSQKHNYSKQFLSPQRRGSQLLHLHLTGRQKDSTAFYQQ